MNFHIGFSIIKLKGENNAKSRTYNFSALDICGLF